MGRTGTLGKQFLIQLRDEAVKRLESLGARVHYAAGTGSQYIKFKDPRIGSLRIADHTGKPKYHYKWNLVVGGERKTVTTDTTTRQYYPAGQMEELCADLRQHQRDIVAQYGPYDPARDPYAMKRKRMLW